MKFYCRDSFPNGRLGHSVFQHHDGKRLPERQPVPGAASTASLQPPLGLPVCRMTRLLHLWAEAAREGGAGSHCMLQPAKVQGSTKNVSSPWLLPLARPRPRDILTHFFTQWDFLCPPVPVSPQPLGSHRQRILCCPHPQYLDFTSTPGLSP